MLAACGSATSRVPLERAEGTVPTTAVVATIPPPTTPLPPPVPPTVAALPDAAAVLSPRGFALPVEGRGPGGWVVQTPCGNRATLAAGAPISAPPIIIDPGHGGGETGAVGPNRLREAIVNMAVSVQAADTLKAAGVNVLLTRPGDDRVVLTTRSELVQKLKPAAFVSVHHNSDPDGPRDTPGTETYYQYRSAPSKRLAGLLYEEIFRTLSAYQVSWVGDTDAGAKYRLNDRGGDYYHVLRETAGVPSVIAELAFISNAPEADLLARPDVQKAEGQAVARGILRWLRTKEPGSGFVTPYPRTTPTVGGGAEGCTDPPL
ncbi:MAG: N-acetylmuramoyl-L-alanine amidase [Acidimicrobiales bacterium]|nr:N-acetylmuramoyl-L-alanine amidase [Acidimicrobiales bacterium]